MFTVLKKTIFIVFFFLPLTFSLGLFIKVNGYFFRGNNSAAQKEIISQTD